jgi:hypothetical protein
MSDLPTPTSSYYPSITMPTMPTLTDPQLAVVAALVPVATLAAGGVVGNAVKLPAEVAVSFSYITTGLLIALVSIELVPELFFEAKKANDRAGAIFGFIAGAILLVGLQAGVKQAKHAEEKVDVGHVPSVALQGGHGEEHGAGGSVKKKFPAASVAAYLIMLWMYGMVMGVSLESAHGMDGAKKPLVFTMAAAIAIDTFVSSTENAALLKESGRPWWESLVVDITAAALLLLGAFIGGELEMLKHNKTKGASAGFFFILGIGVASAMSIISSSQQHAAHSEVEEWYPPMFQYVGFLVILIVNFYASKFKAPHCPPTPGKH